MNVGDFVTELGNLLGEDFTNAPIWTKNELIGYTRQQLKVFSEKTQLVDRNDIRVVNTSGEADAPSDFSDAYYVQYDGAFIDTVPLGDMDFIEATWPTGTTGTPKAASVYGSGNLGRFRVTPVPTAAIGVFGGSVVSTLLMDSPDTSTWVVSLIDAGVVKTTPSAGTAITPILPGPSSRWTLSIDDSGILSTTSSSSTSVHNIHLTDATNGTVYTLEADDTGVIVTNAWVGISVGLQIDSVAQSFDSDLGIIVDAYADNASTTPDYIASVKTPFGLANYAIASENHLTLWYKATIADITNTESQIYLSSAFIPILHHGVLSLAYSHEGTGRDLKKAELLGQIFDIECESVKKIFQRK